MSCTDNSMSTTTNRGRSRGTASTSRNLTCKKSAKNSVSRTLKISKYFAPAGVEVSDSPYKDCLKQVQLDDFTGDLDFATPKAINKVSKIASKPVEKAKRRKTKQAPIRKFLEDNLKQTDVNPDHLQMALALSESSYEAANPQKKKDSFKEAFEKFGFGYSKNRISVEVKKDVKKPNKKSRYKYVTPVLKIRTNEEREALISSKISLILTETNKRVVPSFETLAPELLCNSLKEFNTGKLFKLPGLELEELNAEGLFYVPGLDIEVSPASSGRWLKDWRSIPGRDSTPEREDLSTNVASLECPIGTELASQDSEKTEEVDKYDKGFATPDEQKVVELSFGSDQESEIVAEPSFHARSRQIEDSCVEEKAWKIDLETQVECIDLCSSDEDTCRNITFTEKDTTIEYNSAATPPRRFTLNSTKSPTKSRKRSFDCLSPDLFDSEEELDAPVVSRLRGGKSVSMECYDLDDSDREEKPFHLRMSGPEDSIDRRSDLNVTDYVQNLLSNYKEQTPRKLEKISTSEDDSQLSQNSVCISDEELNYSSVFGTPHVRQNDVENSPTKTSPLGTAGSLGGGLNPYLEQKDALDDELGLNSLGVPLAERLKSTERPPLSKLSPSKVPNFDASFNILGSTPSSSSNPTFVIKTKNVTPMAKYDEMDTPKIVKELDKYGLKPLKRHKGAKLLKYIYESTHPVVDGNNPTKEKNEPQVVGEFHEEVVLESKQSKRIASCAAPLHIVWYNFVMENPKIRENILLYEPLQLEVLHSMLKAEGFKFNIQDLLAFLDKKCITIRTAQGQHHGKKQK